MYKIRFGRTFYFADWDSACEFCVLAGIRIKLIRLREA